MRIDSLNPTINNNSNNKRVNFNGFVDRSVIEHIQGHTLKMLERDIFNKDCPYNLLLRIEGEKNIAESIIKKLKDVMAKMHPATGLYKEESDEYLVLKNKITGNDLDILRISDLKEGYSYGNPEHNVRYLITEGGRDWEVYFDPFEDEFLDAGKRFKWTPASIKGIIELKDYPEIANHIKKKASVYDKELGIDNISETELQTFMEKEKLDVIPLKNKSWLQKFIDKIKIQKFISQFCDSKESIPEYKQALKEYYNMFPDMPHK